MNKKIIFINTGKEDSLPNEFYENLSINGFKIEILTNNTSLLSFFNSNNWPNNKIFKLVPLEKNWLFCILFLLLSPILFSFYFFILLIKKYRDDVRIIICFSQYEKILFTFISKLLKIKSYWIEFPGQNYLHLPKLCLSLFRLNSRWAKIVILNSYSGNKLEKIGFNPKNIILLPPGISHNFNPHQQNIFTHIASSEQKNKNRKFFVLGTSADLNAKQQLEALFWAIKKCVNVIPNIQLIIYGDGKERKNLSWIAKKLEIANLVWFVGAQGNLKKWLDGFDVYVVSSEILKLTDIISTIQAASTGLPIIGPDDIGLDDIVNNGMNGLLTNFHSSDQLAQSIISMQQNRNMRKQFGEYSQALVDKNFTTAKMINKFEEILA